VLVLTEYYNYNIQYIFPIQAWLGYAIYDPILLSDPKTIWTDWWREILVSVLRYRRGSTSMRVMPDSDHVNAQVTEQSILGSDTVIVGVKWEAGNCLSVAGTCVSYTQYAVGIHRTKSAYIHLNTCKPIILMCTCLLSTYLYMYALNSCMLHHYITCIYIKLVVPEG